MSNEHAIYGKTTRNLRIRISVKLVNKKKTNYNGHQNQAICRTKDLTII